MLNRVLENFAFPLGDAVLGTSFTRELKQWRKTSQMPADGLKELQRENLKKLLLFLSKKNSYYKEFLPSPEQVAKADPFELLKTLPLLTKPIIAANTTKLVSDPFKKMKHRLVEEKSSGSSGLQGTVYMTRKEAFSANAAQTHLWEWAGYKLGTELLQLGMTSKRGMVKMVKDISTRTIYRGAFEIEVAALEETLRKFENKPDSIFGGYASGLYTYALYARQYGMNIRFSSVISWGDKMFPHYRKKIEEVFQTRVFDVYGCSEGMIIAGQCSHGSYHILTPHLVLELLDENGKDVAPGKVGHVVVTRLDGLSFPLVRYELGDLAIADHKDSCACGRHYPMLTMIIGRNTDIIYTPSGKALIVHFFTVIFEHEQEIRQYRIIQNQNEEIMVEYITDLLDPSPVIERIRQKLNERSGEVLPISFKRVTHIPPTKSGKPQIIVSHIKNKALS